MDNQSWSSTEGEEYQAMLHRAEQEAQTAWRQGEEYRTRKAKDAALMKVLAPTPSTQTNEDITSSESQQEISIDSSASSPKYHPNPISARQQVSTPPKRNPQIQKSQARRVGLFDRNLGSDSLLLVAVLFFLWRERADKEILLALLYILLW